MRYHHNATSSSERRAVKYHVLVSVVGVLRHHLQLRDTHGSHNSYNAGHAHAAPRARSRLLRSRRSGHGGRGDCRRRRSSSSSRRRRRRLQRNPCVRIERIQRRGTRGNTAVASAYHNAAATTAAAAAAAGAAADATGRVRRGYRGLGDELE